MLMGVLSKGNGDGSLANRPSRLTVAGSSIRRAESQVKQLPVGRVLIPT